MVRSPVLYCIQPELFARATYVPYLFIFPQPPLLPPTPLDSTGELEDALEIALKAAGGVHKQLLELGLSCEDLGKTSVHLSIAAKEAPAEVRWSA